MNLETEHLAELAMPVTPDLLILPSELRPFVKAVNRSVVINPGRLTKHANGGTYARIAVHAPMRNDIPEGTRAVPHGVHSRSVVQIVRI